MLCRFCCNEPENPVVVLPEPAYSTSALTDWQNPAFSAFGCLDCAIKNGYYCTIHDQVHTGFGRQGGHACLQCVNWQAERLEDAAAEILSLLPDGVPATDLSDLREDLDLAGDIITGLGGESKQATPVRCLARFIACVAVSRLTTPEELIEEIRRTRDITLLLTT